MSTATVTDIRSELPVAVKGGTSHKPVWTINGKTYRFVKPADKKGLDANEQKIRLGKRIYAKYEVKTKSPTVPGGVLWFVGVFAEV